MSYAIDRHFVRIAGKKNVTNHITRYEQSANDRAELLKKGGFNNVRIDKTGK